MSYTFNFRDIWAQTKFILEGVGVTLQLCFVALINGWPTQRAPENRKGQ
jgi:hypothetical protein